jgi:1,4-alpha-glucan branching enzyme
MPLKRKKPSKTTKVDFQLNAPDAKKVVLTGDFTSWDSNGITMKRQKNGLWKTDLKLPTGRYEYKFIVDNEWWTDPQNSNTIATSLGVVNSVKDVG